MSEDLERNIAEKQTAIRSDAFLAKKSFDVEKDSFEQYSSTDLDDDYYPEIKELRHELKLMMSIMSESKFDDIVHLISNPLYIRWCPKLVFKRCQCRKSSPKTINILLIMPSMMSSCNKLSTISMELF